jgi:hypothetical protein
VEDDNPAFKCIVETSCLAAKEADLVLASPPASVATVDKKACEGSKSPRRRLFRRLLVNSLFNSVAARENRP